MATRQINVAIPEEWYQRAKACAKSAPMFFRAWIARAIEEQVKRDERKVPK